MYVCSWDMRVDDNNGCRHNCVTVIININININIINIININNNIIVVIIIVNNNSSSNNDIVRAKFFWSINRSTTEIDWWHRGWSRGSLIDRRSHCILHHAQSQSSKEWRQ
jgi:hypothetical protein